MKSSSIFRMAKIVKLCHLVQLLYHLALILFQSSFMIHSPLSRDHIFPTLDPLWSEYQDPATLQTTRHEASEDHDSPAPHIYTQTCFHITYIHHI